MMEPLSESERKIVGFSLFTTSMKLGPPSFGVMERITAKMDVRQEFEHYAKDWIGHSKKNPPQPSQAELVDDHPDSRCWLITEQEMEQIVEAAMEFHEGRPAYRPLHNAREFIQSTPLLRFDK